EIFMEEGQEYFRKLESSLTQEFAQLNNTVISLGGGTLISQDNKTTLEESGVIICLTCELDHLRSRIQNSKRPLASPPEAIKSLYQSREKYYNSIPLQLDSTYDSQLETAHKAIEIWQHNS
ncbi:MAG: hypothetical protein N2D54_04285, partial [Chloroflexota bacterium]